MATRIQKPTTPAGPKPGRKRYPDPRPYVCPVCGGRGTVPFGFYTTPLCATETATEPCRTCDGDGIVWG